MPMSNKSRVGIDTNILVYGLNESSLYYRQARGIFGKFVEQGVQAVVTWQNMAEFYAIVTDVKRFPMALSPLRVERWIENNLDGGTFQLEFPTLSAGEVFLKLIKQIKPVGQKVHDVFLAATLLSNGVKTLITENKEDFAGIKGLKAVDLEGYSFKD